MASISLLLLLLVMLLSTTITHSSSIVKYLPGYAGPLPFPLETGYIGVGESKEMQLFYFFMESEGNAAKDPLMIWLTGGPGCSALTAIFFEIGPLTFNYLAYTSTSKIPPLQLNPYSWTKVASILFIDSPVGAGYSYSNTTQDYNDDFLQTTDVYEFLRKWLIDHPKFMKNPFYVGGDSYSGKTVPILTQKIIDGNQNKLSPYINLKGYILGNPATDIVEVVNSKIEYAHRVSLLSEELYNTAKTSCKGDYSKPDKHNTECVLAVQTSQDIMKTVNAAIVIEPKCIPLSPKPAGIKDPLRRLRPLEVDVPNKWCRNQIHLITYKWANDESVKDALYVRKGTVKMWSRCSVISYSQAAHSSSVDYHQYLTTKSLRSLIYSGDQDMMVPYVDTLKWIKKLDIRTQVAWRPWLVNGHVAGYATDYSNQHYNLTFATVMGGGHTAPEYRPYQCFVMFDKWLRSEYL